MHTCVTADNCRHSRDYATRAALIMGNFDQEEDFKDVH